MTCYIGHTSFFSSKQDNGNLHTGKLHKKMGSLTWLFALEPPILRTKEWHFGGPLDVQRFPKGQENPYPSIPILVPCFFSQTLII